jgi:hypothetical protein
VRWVLTIGALLAWLAAALPAWAQTPVATAGPGALVRVTISPGETLEGVLLSVDDHVASIQVEGSPTAVVVPRRAIARLEKAVGRRSRFLYTGLGALLGTGIGALVASAFTDCSEGCLVSPTIPGAVLGAGAGAVAGAIVTPPRRWIAVDEASLTPVPEAADVETPLSRSPPRLRVAFQLGVSSRGPARDFEETMRRSGFGDTSSGFGQRIAHPVSHTGFGAWDAPMLLEVQARLRPPWALGVMASRTPIGETRGYRADGFQRLFVQYQVVTAGVVLSRDVGLLRLGAGPAWHRAQVREGRGLFEQPWTSTSQVGFVAVASTRLPTSTRLYLDAGVQYRYVGSASVGPIMTADPFSSATLPASEARFNHWLISFGPGIRF